MHAAHIRSVEADGPDTVRNGIALTGTAHWLFDRGLLSFADDYTILLSPHDVPDGLDSDLVRVSPNDLRDESSLSLHVKLEWLPSAHNVIRTSGSSITAANIDLDDFIATQLVECMEMMMSEALLVQAKSKFPHIT